MNSEIGQVVTPDKGCFLWIIDDFLSLAWYGNCSFVSPKFSFSDSLCYISLGFDRQSTLLLYFNVEGHRPSHKLNVRLGMRTGYRGKKETRSGVVNTRGFFCVNVWMPCSEFLERRCEILHNGRLTVFCELRRLDIEDTASVLQEGQPSELDIEDTASVLQEEQPNVGDEKVLVENETSESDSDEEEAIVDWKIVRKLQKDFKSLLKTREDSDLTIKVQEKEFPAHRNILRARSPVFRSMFSHEMLEKHNGVVVIDDCDPVTFPDFLEYVYTGSTRHICDENVCHLYTASDKYCIDELKEECAEFMKNNLSVGSFCDTIALALRHNEKQLIESATAFFCENAREIGKTAKWQIFLLENSTVGNELYLKALSNRKDI